MSPCHNNLYVALRHQLAAVKQHFIHVLILQARGDTESASAINGIDTVDLPNTMKVIQRLVSTSSSLALCKNVDELAQTFPAPGFRNSEICAAEQRLERLITPAFKRFTADDPPIRDSVICDLFAGCLPPRGEYSDWVTSWATAPKPEYVNQAALTPEQTQAIDCLFANMMVVIDQGLVHAFVHRHHGHHELADIAWEISGAAMMQATALTQRLAARGLAAAPSRALTSQGPVAMPCFADDHDTALAADRALARHCVTISRDMEPRFADTEFGQIVTQVQTYFDAVSVWTAGTHLPRIPNPCRDFDRTIRIYLDADSLNKTA